MFGMFAFRALSRRNDFQRVRIAKGSNSSWGPQKNSFKEFEFELGAETYFKKV